MAMMMMCVCMCMRGNFKIFVALLSQLFSSSKFIVYILIRFMCCINTFHGPFLQYLSTYVFRVKQFLHNAKHSLCPSPDSLFLGRDSQVSEVRLPISEGMSGNRSHDGMSEKRK